MNAYAEEHRKASELATQLFHGDINREDPELAGAVLEPFRNYTADRKAILAALIARLMED